MEKISDLRVLKNVLVECITNGVEDNGEIREFDLVDYYLLTDIPTSNLKELLVANGVLNGLTNSEEKILIFNFLARGNIEQPRYIDLFIKKALNDRDIIKGVEITTEAKINIFEFMAENNIPVNPRTYKILLRREANTILKSQEVTK